MMMAQVLMAFVRVRMTDDSVADNCVYCRMILQIIRIIVMMMIIIITVIMVIIMTVFMVMILLLICMRN
jgi:hypothetical protein